MLATWHPLGVLLGLAQEDARWNAGWKLCCIKKNPLIITPN